ncbi:MAG: LuxR C-terminal-related transcriptional regulator, partial [Actinobacteria bacterium]|nr:LuxR C-terminal-related transcriptional regulator [Actinomycetota bacterium]
MLQEAMTIASELGEDYSAATALRYLAELALGRGEYRRAGELVEEAVALTPPDSPPDAMLALLLLRARVAHAHGDRRSTRRRFEEALALARISGATPVPALQGLGRLAAEDGDVDTARGLIEEALTRARGDGNRSGIAHSLYGLGELARSRGHVKEAALLHGEALELLHELGHLPAVAASLEALAGIDPAAGGYEHSARLLGAAQALRDANGYARENWESSRCESDVALVRQGLLAEEFEAALAHGRALSIDKAVAEALRRRGRRGRPLSGWSSLTPREQQIAALVAQGLTNSEVAESAVISHWTVKRHLSNVYEKLGVSDRKQLARAIRSRAGEGKEAE